MAHSYWYYRVRNSLLWLRPSYSLYRLRRYRLQKRLERAGVNKCTASGFACRALDTGKDGERGRRAYAELLEMYTIPGRYMAVLQEAQKTLDNLPTYE